MSEMSERLGTTGARQSGAREPSQRGGAPTVRCPRAWTCHLAWMRDHRECVRARVTCRYPDEQRTPPARGGRPEPDARRSGSARDRKRWPEPAQLLVARTWMPGFVCKQA
jgi:hypothetical protein